MRLLVITCLAACINIALTHAGSAFDIPRGAWQRVIGDIPINCESNCPNRGIALGGFGAGSFMYSISGSFGPWAHEVGEYNGNWLKEAAFHVYERKGDDIRVKCLSTDSVMMPAWDKLQVGDGTYYALQPKGWCGYGCFNSDISSQFFSPIIPHNYRETSYPVAVWQFQLSNPSAETTEVSVMFTWPNSRFNGDRRPRTGFTANLAETLDVLGMVMKASDPSNSPETEDSEWCIAAKRMQGVTVSYMTWNRSASGTDVWHHFSNDGILPNYLNAPDSAAAIAVKTVLAPGDNVILPLVLSWDFPVVEFKSYYGEGQSTQWWKKYCEYFDTLSDNSFDIAVEALQNYQTWDNDVDAWMSTFIDDSRYPDWLLCAAFNELYYNQFGGSFWESGLRSGHPEEFMGLHSDDNKNFIMESQAYTMAGNINVGHYSSIVYAKFWPQMERDLLRCHADVVLHYHQCDPTAPYQTSPEIGSPRVLYAHDSCEIADPFFVLSPHGYLRRDQPCAPGSIHVLTDNSSKFIQRCWRYFYLHDDMEFLGYVWPAVESTYHFMRSYDCEIVPQDSLPESRGYDNTYDGWGMYGTDMYSGGLWVGALEAMDTMAAILNRPVRSEVQAWLEAARRNLDTQLWDAEHLYYRIDTDSDYSPAVFSDALCGQRYCEAHGLPDILPRWKMAAHLRKVYDVCVTPNPDFGAKLGRMPDGSDVSSGDPYTREYWVGTTYYVAALMFRAGLKTEALNTAYGAFYPVYAADHLAYWFNTPEAWCDGGYTPRPRKFPAWRQDHFSRAFETDPDEKDEGSLTFSCPHQYQRPRAVWELVFEIQNDSYFYQCGDANRDGIVSANDVVYLINYLFRNGLPPDPLEAGDANCDGTTDSADIIYLLNYLFRNGLPPCCP